MEPDLDRLLDFESHGGLFPQFDSEWEEAFAVASSIVDELLADGKKRPRVMLYAASPLRFCSVFIAMARLELDLFLCNPRWGRSEREAALAIADPDFVIEQTGDGELTLRGRRSTGSGDAVSMGANKLRVMIPTGGSSGRIRFCIHDWSSLAGAAYGFQQHLSCDHMASLCVLPLYHVSGFMQLVRALLSMGCIVFGSLDELANLCKLLERREGRSTRFLSLVPTQLERLLRTEENVSCLHEFQAIFLGGGPAPVGLVERAKDLKLPLALTYGMTETAAQVATLLPENFLAGNLFQGRALPHVRIRIVSEEDPAIPVEIGEQGIIEVSGRSLFRGYYGDSDPRGRDRFLTSDLGFLDKRGFLTVLGRADRVIISGGEKVNLREVELVLEASGMLNDVAAYGVDDAEWGAKLAVAYVAKDHAFTEDLLRNHVSNELVNFKVPKKWVRLDSIPRNEAGKVLWSEFGQNTGI